MTCHHFHNHQHVACPVDVVVPPPVLFVLHDRQLPNQCWVEQRWIQLSATLAVRNSLDCHILYISWDTRLIYKIWQSKLFCTAKVADSWIQCCSTQHWFDNCLSWSTKRTGGGTTTSTGQATCWWSWIQEFGYVILYVWRISSAHRQSCCWVSHNMEARDVWKVKFVISEWIMPIDLDVSC